MGQIVNVYHGSPNKFDEFSFDFVGSQSGTSGAGFGIYFSDMESEAFIYGENIFKCVLTLKTPLNNKIITLKYNDVKKIIDNCIDVGADNFDKNYQYNEKIAIESFFNGSSSSDTEIIGSMINAGTQIDIIMLVLTSLGYTHTIDVHEDNDLSTHYIVYDLSAIQIINKYTLETR